MHTFVRVRPDCADGQAIEVRSDVCEVVLYPPQVPPPPPKGRPALIRRESSTQGSGLGKSAADPTLGSARYFMVDEVADSIRTLEKPRFATQRELWERHYREIMLGPLVQGFDTCVVCVGPKNSGKSYTLFHHGPPPVGGTAATSSSDAKATGHEVAEASTKSGGSGRERRRFGASTAPIAPVQPVDEMLADDMLGGREGHEEPGSSGLLFRFCEDVFGAEHGFGTKKLSHIELSMVMVVDERPFDVLRCGRELDAVYGLLYSDALGPFWDNLLWLTAARPHELHCHVEAGMQSWASLQSEMFGVGVCSSLVVQLRCFAAGGDDGVVATATFVEIGSFGVAAGEIEAADRLAGRSIASQARNALAEVLAFMTTDDERETGKDGTATVHTHLHVPRDLVRCSVLTYLLQDCFFGNPRASLLSCIRAERGFFEENSATLAIAQKAKLVGAPPDHIDSVGQRTADDLVTGMATTTSHHGGPSSALSSGLDATNYHDSVLARRKRTLREIVLMLQSELDQCDDAKSRAFRQGERQQPVEMESVFAQKRRRIKLRRYMLGDLDAFDDEPIYDQNREDLASNFEQRPRYQVLTEIMEAIQLPAQDRCAESGHQLRVLQDWLQSRGVPVWHPAIARPPTPPGDDGGSALGFGNLFAKKGGEFGGDNGDDEESGATAASLLGTLNTPHAWIISACEATNFRIVHGFTQGVTVAGIGAFRRNRDLLSLAAAESSSTDKEGAEGGGQQREPRPEDDNDDTSEISDGVDQHSSGRGVDNDNDDSDGDDDAEDRIMAEAAARHFLLVSGPDVLTEHCTFERSNHRLVVRPEPGAMVTVNGDLVVDQQELHDHDVVMLGTARFLLVCLPKERLASRAGSRGGGSRQQQRSRGNDRGGGTAGSQRSQRGESAGKEVDSPDAPRENLLWAVDQFGCSLWEACMLLNTRRAVDSLLLDFARQANHGVLEPEEVARIVDEQRNERVGTGLLKDVAWLRSARTTPADLIRVARGLGGAKLRKRFPPPPLVHASAHNDSVGRMIADMVSGGYQYGLYLENAVQKVRAELPKSLIFELSLMVQIGRELSSAAMAMQRPVTFGAVLRHVEAPPWYKSSLVKGNAGVLSVLTNAGVSIAKARGTSGRLRSRKVLARQGSMNMIAASSSVANLLGGPGVSSADFDNDAASDGVGSFGNPTRPGSAQSSSGQRSRRGSAAAVTRSGHPALRRLASMPDMSTASTNLSTLTDTRTTAPSEEEPISETKAGFIAAFGLKKAEPKKPVRRGISLDEATIGTGTRTHTDTGASEYSGGGGIHSTNIVEAAAGANQSKPLPSVWLSVSFSHDFDGIAEGDPPYRGALWDPLKAMNRLSMVRRMERDFEDECMGDLDDLDVLYPIVGDPFYDPPTEQLIGVGYLFQDSLLYLLEVKDTVSLVNYKGFNAGTVEISAQAWINKIESEPDYITLDKETHLEEFIGETLILRFVIGQARGLVRPLAHGVFLSFKFFLHPTPYFTPRHPQFSTNPHINHAIIIQQTITYDLIEYMTNAPLELEVWGSRESLVTPEETALVDAVRKATSLGVVASHAWQNAGQEPASTVRGIIGRHRRGTLTGAASAAIMADNVEDDKHAAITLEGTIKLPQYLLPVVPPNLRPYLVGELHTRWIATHAGEEWDAVSEKNEDEEDEEGDGKDDDSESGAKKGLSAAEAEHLREELMQAKRTAERARQTMSEKQRAWDLSASKTREENMQTKKQLEDRVQELEAKLNSRICVIS